MQAHRDVLARHVLLGTGTTARLITESTGLAVEALLSGPLGGDQQVGARIAEGLVDVDVKALLRLAVLYGVPAASNRATADCLIDSTLLTATRE